MEDYLKGYIVGTFATIALLGVLGIVASRVLEGERRYVVAVGEENAGPGLNVVDGDAQDGADS